MFFVRRNEFVRDLQELEKCSKGVEAMIPIEVLEAIDKGRNPELVTYSLLYVI